MINYFKDLYINIFDKYKHKSNKLLSAIIYSFNLLNDDDIRLLTFFNINYNKDNIKNINSILLSSICMFLSLNISYNFEHMINNQFINNKINICNIYGETISQLVSFCLFLESNNIILESNIDNNTKIKIINSCKNYNFKTDLKDLNLNKEELIKDLNYKLLNILKIQLISILIINNQKIDTILLDNITKTLLNNYILIKTTKNTEKTNQTKKINKIKLTNNEFYNLIINKLNKWIGH